MYSIKFILVFLSFAKISTAYNGNICIKDFYYLKETGKCYKIVKDLLQYDEMKNNCSKKSVSIGLTEINQKEDLRYLLKSYVEQDISAPVWLDAYKKNGEFHWKSNNKAFSSSIFSSVKEGPDIDTCVSMDITNQKIGSDFDFQTILKNVNCKSKNVAICEYKTATCEKRAIDGFDTKSMTLNPNTIFINNNVEVVCKHGYYRIVTERNMYRCTIQSGNPMDFTVAFLSNTTKGKVAECKEVSCEKSDHKFENIKQNGTLFTKTNYGFGEEIKFDCIRGYVDHQNNTSTTSKLTCEQNTQNPNLGVWYPQSLAPCIQVKCNAEKLKNLKPINSDFVMARNRVTNREFNANYQFSKFPYFDNIIDIRCKIGFIFPDRKVLKKVICDLQNNSLIKGKWIGYTGTQLPLPRFCENVTCLYEDVIPQRKHYLQKEFEIRGGILTRPINRTSHTGNTYVYKTQIRFFCLPGYKTGNQESYQELQCAQEGTWVPRLTSCIKETKKLETGNKKKYIPEPIESKNAQEVGAIVIIILVLFLSIIVILDLSTITRDIKILRKNLKILREHNNSQKE